MRKIMSLLLVFVLLLSVSTVAAYAAEGDLVDIASSANEYSILVSALQEAELVVALQGDGPFTVFAPTNKAFFNLLTALDITAGELLEHPQLDEILLYHVVPGKVMSTDLINGTDATTLQGEDLRIYLQNGVMINSSTVTSADIEATNGVIHEIDSVLLPQSFVFVKTVEPVDPVEPAKKDVVDIALGNKDFSMLVSLLTKADLVGTLQSDGPFTVFAPTNQAFEKLLKELDISASELMEQPDLAKILLYHVVLGDVMSTDLINGMEATTANGNTVTFDLINGVKVNESNIINADIDASNGVVHVIDEVLVPLDFQLQAVDMVEEIPQTGDMGLLPYMLIGVFGLAGYAAVNKK